MAHPAGYPFDIPGRNASIFTYCCLAYHLPLSIAFALREHTNFVWGGCMLLPLSDLRSDRIGILAAWNQVGTHGLVDSKPASSWPTAH